MSERMMRVLSERVLPEAEMNRLMCDTLGRRRLMTLALLQFDVARRRLEWVNAGQVFPLLIREGAVRELEHSSYPLGIRRQMSWCRFIMIAMMVMAITMKTPWRLRK